MKKILIVLLAAAMVLTMAACTVSGDTEGTTQEASGSAPETTVPEETTGVETEPETQPDATAGTQPGYGEILDLYYEALSRRWNEEDILSRSLSPLCASCYDGEPLKNVGYALLDLNGDGAEELIIGAISGDAYVEEMVFDLYTLEDGKPVQVFAGQERNSLYLCAEEAGGYLLANQASVDAGHRAWYYDILDGSDLKVVQGILYDDTAEGGPWFMTYDTDWDTANDTPTDEDTALSITDSYLSCRMQPAYTPFESYK